MYYEKDTSAGSFNFRYVGTFYDEYDQKAGGQAQVLISAVENGELPSNTPVQGFANLLNREGNADNKHYASLRWNTGTYGAGEGFYLVLPILGPSSLRDGGGRIVDIFLDPLTYLAPQEVGLGRAVASGIDFRSRNIEELDELKADSLDFYARVRSLYRQFRENEINNGAPSGDSPNFTEIPGPSSSSLE